MKFCIIGLGRFGYEVAITLAHNGMEVLAIDSNEATIASIRDKVTQAICMRVTDEDSLRSIGVDEMDTVIVAMGENFAQSILVTALLKQRLKIPHIITRSISSIHKDILQLIGADEVILPEQEVGRRLADGLSLPFKGLIRLSSQFCISQLPAPEKFVGQRIQDLMLPTNYGVTCIGRKLKEEIEPVNDQHVINADDILVFSGTVKDLTRLTKLA